MKVKRNHAGAFLAQGPSVKPDAVPGGEPHVRGVQLSFQLPEAFRILRREIEEPVGIEIQGRVNAGGGRQPGSDRKPGHD
jgi:hypothetical protein